MILEDGTKDDLTIGDTELRQIVNFDKTDHPFTTENDEGGSRSVRWGDPNLEKVQKELEVHATQQVYMGPAFKVKSYL